MIMGDSERTPDEGMTVGSMSLHTSGNAIRYAAAEARWLMLNLAVEELESWLEKLQVVDGWILDESTERSITYWEISGREII